jgi:general secretion pathway protein G
MPFPPATESPKANRDEARVKTARAYLAALVTAVDMFEIDCGRYPTQKEGLEVLFRDPGIKDWMGPYIRDEKSLNDPWDTALRYAARQNGYIIVSAGPDRKFETDDDIHLK